MNIKKTDKSCFAGSRDLRRSHQIWHLFHATQVSRKLLRQHCCSRAPCSELIAIQRRPVPARIIHCLANRQCNRSLEGSEAQQPCQRDSLFARIDQGGAKAGDDCQRRGVTKSIYGSFSKNLLVDRGATLLSSAADCEPAIITPNLGIGTNVPSQVMGIQPMPKSPLVLSHAHL